MQVRRIDAIAVAVGVAVFVAAAGGITSASAVARASGGTWASAEEVPDTAVLNQGGHAAVASVSCASAGNCSAGGYYKDGSGKPQAFVADETNDAWGAAQEVPGTAALNQGGNAGINAVSCASAGSCSAGGGYTNNSGIQQAFVADETNGTWGTAEQVPGTAALAQGGGHAWTIAASCATAGNCGAGGYYLDVAGHYQVFVVSETNGSWGTAQQVPGTAALNQGGFAEFNAVSCASASYCSAGGDYRDASGNVQAFVVDETNGTWGTAQEVPGTAALNQGGTAAIYAVSCASAGNCSAGGYYTDASGRHAFVAGEKNGTWGTAQEVPGTAALNQGGNAWTTSVSCASAGNCSAGGYYKDGSGKFQAFVVNEKKGTWTAAQQVPGTATLNLGGNGGINAVSCASAGNCSAGGTYTDSSAQQQAFVVDEKKGTWGTAQEVPGTAGLNQGGGATINAVSCASADSCGAGGYYTDSSIQQQAFVVRKQR